MWDTYLTPAGIAAAMSLIVKLISMFVTSRKIKVNDETCQRTTLLKENDELREALMKERQDMVKELRSVAERCDKLENENAELHQKVIELAKQNALLEIEIERLRGTIENE